MRPIEFRAWHKEHKKMYECYLVSFANGQCGLKDFGMELSERLILMQFTGLLDKKKKKIWEGDIFEGHARITTGCDDGCVLARWKVEWFYYDTPCFDAILVYKPCENEVSTPQLSQIAMNNVEVIDYIHDNSELLEATQ